MGTVSALHHVNGGEPQAIQCANCHTYLGDERAVAHTHAGVKFFCKQEQGDKPEDSCYLQWRRRTH